MDRRRGWAVQNPARASWVSVHIWVAGRVYHDLVDSIKREHSIANKSFTTFPWYGRRTYQYSSHDSVSCPWESLCSTAGRGVFWERCLLTGGFHRSADNRRCEGGRPNCDSVRDWGTWRASSERSVAIQAGQRAKRCFRNESCRKGGWQEGQCTDSKHTERHATGSDGWMS